MKEADSKNPGKGIGGAPSKVLWLLCGAMIVSATLLLALAQYGGLVGLDFSDTPIPMVFQIAAAGETLAAMFFASKAMAAAARESAAG